MTEPGTSPRERILDAAQEVFSARGYRGGSLNEVATRSGYTRAGLLHHYPSKEGILLALLEERDDRFHLNDLDDEAELSVFAFLDRAMSMVASVLADRQLVLLAHTLTAEAAGRDHPARDWVARRQERFRRRAVRSIRHSVAVGELPADLDAEALAVLMLGAAEGVEAQWLIDEQVDPTRALRLVRLLVEGIRLA